MTPTPQVPRVPGHTPRAPFAPLETLCRHEVLAPMVRAGTLALRLQSLRYGAGLVYGEEIIDRKIIGAVRVESEEFKTINYVSPREKVVVFSTCAEERQRVVFQLGTANAALATEAALLVCKDVRGIDINMGCPKSYSVKGGMGAALLKTPEIVEDILKTLRRNLPSECRLTCKIRLLEEASKTRDFMQLCERSGAEMIAVHMRRREERPAQPAHWEEILKVWDAVKVPVIANGDFFTRASIHQFWGHIDKGIPEQVSNPQRGPVAVMVARGALANPGIFDRTAENVAVSEEVVQEYVRAAVQVNAPYQNVKWVLSQMLAGSPGVPGLTEFRGQKTKVFQQELSRSKSMKSICDLVGEALSPELFPVDAWTTSFYKDYPFPEASCTSEASTSQLTPHDRTMNGVRLKRRIEPDALTPGSDALEENMPDSKRVRAESSEP